MRIVRSSIVPHASATRRMLLSLDYSQCEFRVAAELSADANLIRAFETGKDPYAELAAECSITRREAKIVSIGKFTAVPTQPPAACDTMRKVIAHVPLLSHACTRFSRVFDHQGYSMAKVI